MKTFAVETSYLQSVLLLRVCSRIAQSYVFEHPCMKLDETTALIALVITYLQTEWLLPHRQCLPLPMSSVGE